MSDQGDADRLADIGGRLAKTTPGPWAVNRLRYIDAVDANGQRRERGMRSTGDAFPRVGIVDSPGDADFIAASIADVPWLCDRLLESYGIIADMMQDGSYRRGIATGRLQAMEILHRQAVDYAKARGEGDFATYHNPVWTAFVAVLGETPLEPPLPPDALLRRYGEMKSALRRISEAYQSGTVGSAISAERMCVIAREALGGKHDK